MSKAKDADSWKAHSIERRDFRHTHDGPEISTLKAKAKYKKDTKRWCRGKEGREHDYVKIDQFRFLYTKFKKFRCGGCQKIMWETVKYNP